MLIRENGCMHNLAVFNRISRILTMFQILDMTYYVLIIFNIPLYFKFTIGNCINKMLFLKVENEGLENQQKLF